VPQKKDEIPARASPLHPVVAVIVVVVLAAAGFYVYAVPAIEARWAVWGIWVEVGLAIIAIGGVGFLWWWWRMRGLHLVTRTA
jgi:protein-S-isoprenylcysteine O-methyltransferase Ste14